MKHTSAASLTEIPPFAPGSCTGRSLNKPSNFSASMPCRPLNSAASTLLAQCQYHHQRFRVGGNRHILVKSIVLPVSAIHRIHKK